MEIHNVSNNFSVNTPQALRGIAAQAQQAPRSARLPRRLGLLSGIVACDGCQPTAANIEARASVAPQM